MSWMYRVVKHTEEDEGVALFGIHEVYSYGGKSSSIVDRKAPIGTSVDKLRADLGMMLRALDSPVLEERQGGLVEVSE